MSEILRHAFLKTDKEFLAIAKQEFAANPLVAAIGSSCLVGFICEGMLYVANAGDSRAVLGYVVGHEATPIQLSIDHTVDDINIRTELIDEHSFYDPDIVLNDGCGWRVKGMLQTTRSIGDGYMKRRSFAIGHDINPRYYMRHPIISPAVVPDPTIQRIVLKHFHRFVIFGSRGLWDLISNEEAVAIVHKHPREGIARRLVCTGLLRRAASRGKAYEDLKQMPFDDRRAFHDDVTAVVIFLHHLSPNIEVYPWKTRSFKAFNDDYVKSEFEVMKEAGTKGGTLSCFTGKHFRPGPEGGGGPPPLRNFIDTSVNHFMWATDAEKHYLGNVSYAIHQGNQVMEDYSDVDTGPSCTFVGVFDGHGGDRVARFCHERLLRNLIDRAVESGTMSEAMIGSVFTETDEEFLAIVEKELTVNPTVATVGSCCLVGVIWEGTLYVANSGDSRAVLGVADRHSPIIAEQMSIDHIADDPAIRRELYVEHPDVSDLFSREHNRWRVKGIIKITRSIGDGYMKRPEFAVARYVNSKYYISEPIIRPLLKSEPTFKQVVLKPNHRFVIFASHGFWELISNEEAVEMVYKEPQEEIATRLICTVLHRAAASHGKSFWQLKCKGLDNRRSCHDDITVVVLYLNRLVPRSIQAFSASASRESAFNRM